MLTPVAAGRAGGLYSDADFDLSRLDALRPRTAEPGRSCTDPAYRTGGVVLLLWSALAEFMQRNQLDLTVGCASVPMHGGGHAAARLWHPLRLRQQRLAVGRQRRRDEGQALGALPPRRDLEGDGCAESSVTRRSPHRHQAGLASTAPR